MEYINPRQPPADNLRFALMNKMICAGQSAAGIREFLEEKGINIEE